jgi:hypothetical protein
MCTYPHGVPRHIERDREPPPYCTKNPIYVFPERKMNGLVPNSYVHVSVNDLYIPRYQYTNVEIIYIFLLTAEA